MTFASWVAMVAGMLLSLVDMFFLSRLDDIDVLAAMAFSGSIGLFTVSIGIGFSVSTSVLVSQKITRVGQEEANHLFSAICAMGLAIGILFTAILLSLLPYLLSMLGAESAPFEYAMSYLQLTLLASPLGVLAMIFASGLRAAAMAKASMWISLSATVINIILDPILIEVLGWGIDGAAWATVISRISTFLIGIWYFGYKIKWFKPVSLDFIKQEIPSVRRIASPALISSLFTPIGSMLVVWIVSDYGSEAMAGMGIVGSLSPILFSVFFSISGSAGPMVGQNIGAKRPERVVEIYQTSLGFIASYTLVVWLVGILAHGLIARLFGITGLPAELVMVYCTVQIPLSMGLGAIAISNGIFNNLGKPEWSMRVSLARATIGTLVFSYLGSELFGLYGAIIGSSMTFFVFGSLAVYLANNLFKKRCEGLSLFPSANSNLKAVEGS
jgi:putative MATE family efflux protein